MISALSGLWILFTYLQMNNIKFTTLNPLQPRANKQKFCLKHTHTKKKTEREREICLKREASEVHEWKSEWAEGRKRPLSALQILKIFFEVSNIANFKKRDAVS